MKSSSQLPAGLFACPSDCGCLVWPAIAAPAQHLGAGTSMGTQCPPTPSSSPLCWVDSPHRVLSPVSSTSFRLVTTAHHPQPVSLGVGRLGREKGVWRVAGLGVRVPGHMYVFFGRYNA